MKKKENPFKTTNVKDGYYTEYDDCRVENFEFIGMEAYDAFELDNFSHPLLNDMLIDITNLSKQISDPFIAVGVDRKEIKRNQVVMQRIAANKRTRSDLIRKLGWKTFELYKQEGLFASRIEPYLESIKQVKITELKKNSISASKETEKPKASKKSKKIEGFSKIKSVTTKTVKAPLVVPKLLNKSIKKSMTIKCSCGQMISRKSKFCHSCGYELRKKCSCGAPIKEDALFCNKCGLSIYNLVQINSQPVNQHVELSQPQLESSDCTITLAQTVITKTECFCGSLVETNQVICQLCGRKVVK